ncbi:MAG: PilZ domain-containing protein [Elusimicrobia bacterium]|nr:PilZ domain-containing protein [Elusimicrobiota bacterium]
MESEPQPKADRRKYCRIPTDIEIQYKPATDPEWNGISTKATAVNISPMGLCLVVGEHFASGTVLELAFTWPESGEYVDGLCRVVWCRKKQSADKPCYLVGAEFLAGSADFLDKSYHAQAQKVIESNCGIQILLNK